MGKQENNITTPYGDWIVEKLDAGLYIVYGHKKNNSDSLIEVCTIDHGEANNVSAKSTAHLISAVKDMYFALDDLIEDILKQNANFRSTPLIQKGIRALNKAQNKK